MPWNDNVRTTSEIPQKIRLRYALCVEIKGATFSDDHAMVVQLVQGLLSHQVQLLLKAGARGALLSYAILGLMVYFLMTSLGGLAAFMPVSGSFFNLWL